MLYNELLLLLQKILFCFDKNINNDNLEVYKGESKDAIIDVICLFVTGETKIKVENAIKQFINNQDK